MTIEKISVNGHYVWVDKDSEIKEGDRYYLQSVTTQNMILKASENKSSSNCYKIIAASPELNLEGVPSYVEWLGTQRAIERRWDPKSLETRRVANEIIEGVKFGYQAAEKELFTEDDVKRVVELIVTWESMEIKTTTSLEKATEEIIEQIKQEKK